MKKTLRRLAASVLAAATMCVFAVSANAEDTDDPNPGSCKSWDVRCVGAGAPSSVDKTNRFWVYNISSGHIGTCLTLNTYATEFGVKAECIDGKHIITTQRWNGKGEKRWSTGDPSSSVRYKVNAYGRYTNSTGEICINDK